MNMSRLQSIADQLILERLMRFLADEFGGCKLLEHWTQGEFHHDLIFSIADPDTPILVVSTNCNGGVKDVMSFREVPERYALWNFRCPDNTDFDGICEPIDIARTLHWFEPCEILVDDARSELNVEHRRRQFGGGWEPIG